MALKAVLLVVLALAANCTWAAEQTKPRLIDAYVLVDKLPADNGHAKLATALIRVYERMSAASGEHATLVYSPDPVYNAFATVHNQKRLIAFYRPIVQDLRSDPDALAYVVGHELGHHIAGHTTAGAQARQTIAAIAALAGALVDRNLEKHGSRSIGTGQIAGSIVGNLAVLKFTRDQEREADSIAVRIMAKAGFDPSGALRAQEAFLRKAGDHEFVLFDSHPSSHERLENLRAQIEFEPALIAAVRTARPPNTVSASATQPRSAPSADAPRTSNDSTFVPSFRTALLREDREFKIDPDAHGGVALWRANERVQEVFRLTEGKSANDRAQSLKGLAEEGNADAAAEYAGMLASGRGVAAVDRREACHIARQAWEANSAGGGALWALCLAGGLGGGQIAEDRKMAYSLANDLWENRRVRNALVVKGMCYEFGYGVPKNIEAAHAIFKYAVGLGDLQAAYRVAKMMQSGTLKGYSHDQVETVFEDVAAHGHPAAMIEYAEILRKQNHPVEAYAWSSLAGVHGEPRAAALKSQLRDELARIGSPAPEAAYQALEARVKENRNRELRVP